MSDDSMANNEVVVVFDANVTELLRLNVLVLDCSDFFSLVVQGNETISHFQPLFAFPVFVSLPLATVCKEEMVGSAPGLAT